MRKLIFVVMGLLAAGIVSAGQDNTIRLMPAWTPQSQFAGYYAAQELGFYAEEGLSVQIVHQGRNSAVSNLDELQAGAVDIAVASPIMALACSSEGSRVVNVLQLAQVSSLAIVCREPVKSIADLEGKKIGRWKHGYGDAIEIFIKKNGVSASWITFLGGVNLFIAGAVDATTCMTYNEYYTIKESIGNIPPQNVLRLSEYGYELPEDGLYVKEAYLAAHKAEIDAFCEATKRGWLWCMEHKKEAVEFVMQYAAMEGIRTNRLHQENMLDEFLRSLVNPRSGKVDFQHLDKEVYDSCVEGMLENNFISENISYGEFCR